MIDDRPRVGFQAMLQAKVLAEQMLMTMRELVDELRMLRRELAARKTTTGGERNE